jgi:hypothetical protein
MLLSLSAYNYEPLSSQGLWRVKGKAIPVTVRGGP